MADSEAVSVDQAERDARHVAAYYVIPTLEEALAIVESEVCACFFFFCFFFSSVSSGVV